MPPRRRVYGIKDEAEVTEELSLEPLTDYSKFKAMCEEVLAEERAPGFVTCTLRPATVCGYAPRQRLDVVVNILTNQAVNTRRIKVLGGTQKRPNIHVEDMADLYCFLLQQPDEKIDGEVYNAGYENHLADAARRDGQAARSATTSRSTWCRPTICAPTMCPRKRCAASSDSSPSIRSRRRCAAWSTAFRGRQAAELARGPAVFQHQAHAGSSA